MSADTPTPDDVEGLATLLLDGIRDAMPFPTSTDEWITVTRVVRSILARELARRDAAVAAKARAEALAPIRALADQWEVEAADDERWLNGPRVSVSEAQQYPATIAQARTHADVLRAALAAAEGTET